jgi:hypothetical protein
MTRFAASACLTALLACSATAELKPSSEVTVILNFKGPHSAELRERCKEKPLSY